METKNVSDRRKCAGKMLQEVLAGKISPASARDSWPEIDGDDSLESAFHSLFHFEDDSDIRQRDPEYADWQTSQLRHMADALTSGDPLSKHQIEWLTPRPKS